MIDSYTDSPPLSGYLDVPAAFYITRDGLTLQYYYQEAIDINGYFDAYFNPSCAYEVRDQIWTGQINGSVRYYDSYSDNYTVTVESILNATLLQPQLYIVKDEENANIYANVQDLDSSCGYITGASVIFHVIL